MKSPSPARPLLPDIAVVTAVMALVLYRFSETVADPDLWGHVSFGRLIWESRAVALPDPFSYVTAGQPWMNHEWLAEVLFHLAFTSMGPRGLILLKTAVSLFVFGLLYWHLCREMLTPLRAGLLVLVVLHFFLPSLITARPMLFSFPFFLVVLIAIRRLTVGETTWAWALPPLFALWANLHGGFLAGIGLLAVWAITELAVRARSRRRSNVMHRPPTWAIPTLLVASTAATLINPYGLGLLRFLAHTATVPRPDITEWQPLTLMSRYGLAYAAYVGVAIWGLLQSRRERSPASLTVLIVLIVLPLMALRHASLSALGIAVFAGAHINDAWERAIGARSGTRAGSARRIQAAAIVFLLLAAAVFVTRSVSHLSCIRLEPLIGGSYPLRAVRLIKDSNANANIAIHFDWGEYAIYHLAPSIKVSVDGRRETVYPPTAYLENQRFMRGLGDWDALLRNHDTDLALVPTGSPTFNLMALKPGWRLIYEDRLAGLFGRDDLPTTDAIARTVPPALPIDGAGSCFP